MANIFQTTLLVLYFVTPAETVHLPSLNGNKALAAKEAFEKTKIWTLQSTSQVSTESPYMCVANGKLLQEKFAQVSTATVRLYCLCPEDSVKNKDPNCEKEQQRTGRLKLLDKNGASPPAAIIEIGPDTVPIPPNQ
jgi:hypothetical protein